MAVTLLILEGIIAIKEGTTAKNQREKGSYGHLYFQLELLSCWTFVY